MAGITIQIVTDPLKLPITNFSDAETPTVAGNQLVLQHAPSPAASLQFFRNGVVQAAGSDYLLSGFFIVPSPAPAAGDVFLCWYRF